MYKIVILFFFLTLSGCATYPVAMPPSASAPRPSPLPAIPGVYHRVERGQTLWRISKMYGVDLEELVSCNRISDVTNIEIGQQLLIPHRNQLLASSSNMAGEDFIWPLKGKVIGSFGQTINHMVNKGITIQPLRDSTVVAARAGRVVFYTPDLEGYGKTVIIDHADGFSTVYAGNSEVLIRLGDRVSKGTAIAKVNPGSRNYLQFQIRKGRIAQNPTFFLSP